MMTLFLNLQMCSGKNAIGITRTGRHYPKKRFVDWRANAAGQLAKQLHGHITITKPVKMMCDYFPGDMRTRDVTGMLDALFHLLVYAAVIQDDGLIWDCEWKRQGVSDFPKVCIDLYEW